MYVFKYRDIQNICIPEVKKPLFQYTIISVSHRFWLLWHRKVGGITTSLPFSSRKTFANDNVANTAQIFVWGFVKGRLESRQIGLQSG